MTAYFIEGGWFDTEVGEGGDGVGHEAFAAGLVDGRGHAVGDLDGKAVLGGGDGSSEAAGASAGDKDIGGVQDDRVLRIQRRTKVHSTCF